MQTRTDSQEKQWCVRLNGSSWASAKDWPDWANPHQREKWREKGLIVWDQETQTVARLRGRHALAILAQLRDSDEWEQQGCVVGEPAWRLSLDNPDEKGEPVLADQIVLDPEQATALFDTLVQEEGVLQKMAAEEEAEERRVLAQVYDMLLQAGERGKHTVYDESLSWEENRRIMRERWESGELPEKLSWTERKLFHEVLDEIQAERKRKELQDQERARRIKRNLLNHHFFWERLKGIWLRLHPDERLHILQLLQDEEWNDRTLAQVRQIIEGAQFFAGLSERAGAAEETQKVTAEELRLILDLPDNTLWDELIDLYRQRSDASGDT